MIPEDDDEHRMIDCWTMSIKSGFAAAECDNTIVMIYCDRYELDKLEAIRICKQMTTAFNIAQKK